MTQITKPNGRLSTTNWLTTAADAEPGMTLVIDTGDEIVRTEIIESDTDYGLLTDERGKTYAWGQIDASRRMVIE